MSYPKYEIVYFSDTKEHHYAYTLAKQYSTEGEAKKICDEYNKGNHFEIVMKYLFDEDKPEDSIQWKEGEKGRFQVSENRGTILK